MNQKNPMQRIIAPTTEQTTAATIAPTDFCDEDDAAPEDGVLEETAVE